MEKKDIKPTEKMVTIPNILTMVRILLVPFVVYFIFHGNLPVALIFFLAACLTDLVDGFVARHFNMVSKVGIFLDPFADKFMAIATLLSFALNPAKPGGPPIIPLWMVIVIFAKELIMVIGGLIIMNNGYSTPANKLGKLCAFVFNVAIASCFLCFIDWWNSYYIYFVGFGLALSVFSMVQYAILNGRLLFTKNPDRKKKAEETDEEENDVD